MVSQMYDGRGWLPGKPGIGHSVTVVHPNRLATSAQFTTCHQLATYSLRLFW